MRAIRVLDGSFTVMGGRVPRVVGLLMGVTLVASVVGAVGARNGFPLLLAGVLTPGLVIDGQVWRLVTWVFFEPEGLALIFGLLGLWWFGRDLYFAWGATRLLATYLGIAAAAGLGTCLVALAWPVLNQVPYWGVWPVVSSLIIAWATLNPNRDVYVYFVLPLRGRNLILVTLGGTLLFALLDGPARFVPHFLAQGFMLAWLNPPEGLQRFWRQARLRSSLRRAPKLRAVDREEPPRWLH
jgi:membrane associated rhomboid family serine protease